MTKKTKTKSSPPVMKEERKWKVQEALSTLKRAEEIKKDKPMMKDCKKMAKEEMAMMSKIAKKGM